MSWQELRDKKYGEVIPSWYNPFVNHPMFGVALTVLFYLAARALHHR
jgi:hypothetical protein